jgi:hypothetical protein
MGCAGQRGPWDCSGLRLQPLTPRQFRVLVTENPPDGVVCGSVHFVPDMSDLVNPLTYEANT